MSMQKDFTMIVHINSIVKFTQQKPYLTG